MTDDRTAGAPAFEDRVFLWLVIGVSIAFARVLWPFFGAVLWAIIIAIVFAPLYRRLLRSLGQRRTAAALATELLVLVLVILPVGLIASLLVQEALGTYERIQSGDLDFGRLFQQVLDALPAWVTDRLDRLGLSSIGQVRDRLSASLRQGAQFLASQAVNLGHNTFSFLVRLFAMLYMLFFLIRDGDRLAGRITRAIPLKPDQKRDLARQFTVVIRATVKGNVVVAVVQGALGGLILWVLGIGAPALWGALMVLLSLLPAVGVAIVWAPVAIYLMATGSVGRGLILVAFGGIALFGFNGFVVGPLIAALFISV